MTPGPDISKMAPTLYFGVELEFCLGYILPGMPSPDHVPPHIDFQVPERAVAHHLADLEHRAGSPITLDQLVHPTPGDSVFSRQTISEDRERLVLPYVRNHIVQTIHTEELPCSNTSLGDLDIWAIGRDPSINTTSSDSKMLLFPMEITSPAYEFTPESLRAVEKFCKVLRANYHTEVNSSCGLHVHISFGKDFNHETKRWTFERLQKLMMFVWAFEPQLQTIHPDHRQEGGNQGDFADAQAIPIRTGSSLSLQLRSRQETAGSPRRFGLDEIYRAHDLHKLEYLVSSEGRQKVMAVSIYHITFCYDYPNERMNSRRTKPTVEFRQHAGTLDGEQVVKWVETLVGIIQWLEQKDDLDPEAFMKLAKECREKSEKVIRQARRSVIGEGEERRRPMTGEGEDAFTIVDLLECIGLLEQARYYSARLFDSVQELGQ